MIFNFEHAAPHTYTGGSASAPSAAALPPQCTAPTASVSVREVHEAEGPAPRSELQQVRARARARARARVRLDYYLECLVGFELLLL